MTHLLSENVAKRIVNRLTVTLKNQLGQAQFMTEAGIAVVTAHCEKTLREVALFNAEQRFLRTALLNADDVIPVDAVAILTIVGGITQEKKLLPPVKTGLAGLYFSHTKYNYTAPLAVGSAIVSTFWKSEPKSANAQQTEAPAYIPHTEAITTRMIAREIHLAIIQLMNFDDLNNLATELYNFSGEAKASANDIDSNQGTNHCDASAANLQMRQEQRKGWQLMTGKAYGATHTWHEIVAAVKIRAEKLISENSELEVYSIALSKILKEQIPSHVRDTVVAAVTNYKEHRAEVRRRQLLQDVSGFVEDDDDDDYSTRHRGPRYSNLHNRTDE